MLKNLIKESLVPRLREPSTWRGLALAAGALGIGINPDLLVSIGSTVAGALSVIEIIRRED